MVVDVGTYIDGYIHYKSNVASAWIDTSNSFAEKKRAEALSKLLDNGAENLARALMKSINNFKEQAKTTVNLAKEVSLGGALEEILLSIADKMNESLSNNFGETISSFSNIRSKVQAYGNSNFQIKDKAFQGIDGFFNLLNEALKLLLSGVSDEDVTNIQALLEIFNGRSSANAGKFITKNALTTGEKIVNYLATAAKELLGGNLTKNSFRGTITNIFSTAIGEPLAAQMMQSILQDIANNTENIVIDLLLAVARSNPNIKLTGTMRYENNKNQKRTSKVDALGNNTFLLTVTYNEGDMQKTATLELSSNLSIKWQQKASKTVHFVGGTSLPSALNTMGADNKVVTAAYNVIAHRYSSNYGKGKLDIKKESKKGDFYGAYRQLRGSIAANFFVDWLGGSGKYLVGMGDSVDKAQFFMYNGLVYSVISIIKNILANQEKLNTIAQFSGVKKIDNSFRDANGKNGEASKSAMSWELARARSRDVWAAINGITISATLNINMLKALT